MSLKILIIDDELHIRRTLTSLLNDQGYEVSSIDNGEMALKYVNENHIDMIFLDVMLPGIDGIEILKRIKESKPLITVVMISGHADLSIAVKATKLGAYDFLEKPFKAEKVLLSAKNVLQKLKIENEISQLKKLVDLEYNIVGQTHAMRELNNSVRKAAPSDGRILILGENGTGKELIAREIHEHSKRADKPFIKLNCAAIPKELIESELFGYEKGAFTGAEKRKTGLIEEANKGTLFLDEVGDMSLDTQAKLLRVLQENEFKRVGGNESIKFDVRVVSATNKNLENMIVNGDFREDLYFRLNVIPIRVPPLRERIDDIPLLADYFLKTYSIRNEKKTKKINEAGKLVLKNYNWPGNVRELKNLIERLVIMTDGNEIGDFEVNKFLNRTEEAPENKKIDAYAQLPLRERLIQFEFDLLNEEFKQTSGNITQMALRLKTDRSNLSRKLKKLGIK